MKVSDLVDSYVSYRRSLGMRYHTQADFLKSFVRAAGDTDIREVRPDTIRGLLVVKGRVTASWEQRHSTLSGLYRFAIRPQIPCPRTPHIYSVDEIKRLLSATASLTGTCQRL
jgi:integrase/recombinase XerD